MIKFVHFKPLSQFRNNLPKVNKLLLMFCDSVNAPPTDLVSFTLSLPRVIEDQCCNNGLQIYKSHRKNDSF